MHSITGSFISDTLTLNGVNGEEGGVKYFPKKLDLNTHGKNLNDLMVVGQSCFKVIREKTRDEDDEDDKVMVEFINESFRVNQSKNTVTRCSPIYLLLKID